MTAKIFYYDEPIRVGDRFAYENGTYPFEATVTKLVNGRFDSEKRVTYINRQGETLDVTASDFASGYLYGPRHRRLN